MPIGKLMTLYCGGSKEQFATKADAELAAETLRKKYRQTHGRQARKVYTYQCPVCEAYHIGHRRKNGKRLQ